jgi:SAM-dependent methyltransferase
MFGPRHEHRLAMIVREVERMQTGSRVLDAAAGLGQLARKVYDAGYRVVGIDYSFDAALHVRRTLPVPAVVGDMTKLPFKPGVFDGVTTGETLEHLDDDRAAVGELGRVLKSGGQIVATVPALQSLWSQSDDYYEHRRRYAREALVGLFQDVGLAVEKASFWGFPIVLAYDTLFLLPMNKRRARRSVQTDAALRGVARAGRMRFLVGLMRCVFSIDRLFSFVPFGPGLLLVARKR